MVLKMNCSKASIGALIGWACSAAMVAATPALAQDAPALKLSLDYTADVSGVVSGGLAQRGRLLDDLQIGADIDLDKALGWSGATAHVTLMNNAGGIPNDAAGALQGIDNIEVSQQRARLFEAWIQQGFGGDQGSILAGLYDVNSEFYANDSAGLLIAPAFGIGSELAATGPNGPSIFPSTALAVRLRWQSGEARYVQAAVINAQAGVLGDPGGVNLSFDNGILAIAEAGWTSVKTGKLAVGAWAYSQSQDDWRAVTPAGDPVKRRAGGVYLLAERRLAGEEDGPRRVTGFARLGVSDGATSPFEGGWQAGVLIEQPFAQRPHSALSLGVNQAFITGRERANGVDAGRDIGRTETAFEITYADNLTEHLIVQPDLQYILRPAGDRNIDNALVATLRLKISY